MGPEYFKQVFLSMALKKMYESTYNTTPANKVSLD